MTVESIDEVETDLLQPPAGRWTPGHKARVVQAVAAGTIALVDIVAAGISIEEFVGWENSFAAFGCKGLRVTEPSRAISLAEQVISRVRELCAERGVAYMLSPGETSIICGQCGMTSYNPHDVQERYCGNCHGLHEDRK